MSLEPSDLGKVMWLGDLAKVQLGPDDIIVLMHPNRLSTEVRTYIKSIWEHLMPNHKCIVLDEGMRVGVVTAGSSLTDKAA